MAHTLLNALEPERDLTIWLMPGQENVRSLVPLLRFLEDKPIEIDASSVQEFFEQLERQTGIQVFLSPSVKTMPLAMSAHGVAAGSMLSSVVELVELEHAVLTDIGDIPPIVALWPKKVPDGGQDMAEDGGGVSSPP
jgi:hypothetical protein